MWWCFWHFGFEMRFVPQRRALFPQWRALFRHLSFQKCSERVVLSELWLRHVLRATTASTFCRLQLPKVLWSWGAFTIVEMCFAPLPGALFEQLNILLRACPLHSGHPQGAIFPTAPPDHPHHPAPRALPEDSAEMDPALVSSPLSMTSPNEMEGFHWCLMISMGGLITKLDCQWGGILKRGLKIWNLLMQNQSYWGLNGFVYTRKSELKNHAFPVWNMPSTNPLE